MLINQWNARFYNALQDRNWDAFVTRAAVLLRARRRASSCCAVYQLYLNQWLQIRWRRLLTTALSRRLARRDGNHYRMQLLGDAADNPDQRIAEDIKQFIDGGSNSVGILPIGLGLLNAIVTLGVVRGDPVGPVGSRAAARFSAWIDPGLLVWAALIYAIAGTLLTHLDRPPADRAQLQPAAL